MLEPLKSSVGYFNIMLWFISQGSTTQFPIMSQKGIRITTKLKRYVNHSGLNNPHHSAHTGLVTC